MVSIYVPPLRERIEEIPVLVEYFNNKYAQEFKKKAPALSTELLELFQHYHWPGNIRELENYMKKIIVLGNDQAVYQELEKKRGDLIEDVSRESTELVDEINKNLEQYSLKAFSKEVIRHAEKEIIGKVLQQTCWNRKEAAERLQISYKALLYKIKETGLEK